jgi:hypothetical protein
MTGNVKCVWLWKCLKISMKKRNAENEKWRRREAMKMKEENREEKREMKISK